MVAGNLKKRKGQMQDGGGRASLALSGPTPPAGPPAGAWSSPGEGNPDQKSIPIFSCLPLNLWRPLLLEAFHLSVQKLKGYSDQEYYHG